MNGVCFQDVGVVAWQSLEDARLEAAGDAIVRVELAGLCGSDMHPFLGREKGLSPGTVMGHEFVGEIVAVGRDVRQRAIGERVCAPFSTSCGECYFCLKGLTSRCLRSQLFGWRNGQGGLHGGQAEYVRVPDADGTLVPLRDHPHELGLLMGDNLATGFYCADMAGVGPHGVHVVIGCGTVGLLCLLACQTRDVTPDNLLAYDPQPARASMAKAFGATAYSNEAALMAEIQSRTEGRGADSVMELVGLPDAQRLAFACLRPGGTLSVIGCHCTPHFAFSPADAYDKNLIYRTGRCPARAYMDRLGFVVEQHADALRSLITHRFPACDGVEAYRIFSTRGDGCIKAVLEFDGP